MNRNQNTPNHPPRIAQPNRASAAAFSIRLAGLCGLFIPLLATACGSPGVRWQVGTYHDVHRQAATANQLTFVYLRSWYLVECTDFEENILKDPEVLAETRQMACVPLDFDWDQSLAKRWRIDKVPAFVIVAPTGEILARGQYPIAKAELLDNIHNAQNAFQQQLEAATD